MNKKNIILFMPTIDVGGVEKNFIIISNYLSQKFDKINVITTSTSKRKQFSKKIKFDSFKIKFIEKLPRRLKFFIGLLILAKQLIRNKNNLVISFQANVYCVYLCKLLNSKVIVRSNTSPTNWSKNIFKNLIYKNALSITDALIVNSYEFKNLIKKKFNIKSTCIYNPLNKNEILDKSKKKINLTFFKKNTFNFINVARLDEQKDQLTLLKAFLILKKHLNFRLILIGSGKKEKKLRKFINENGLNNQVKIKNNITNPFPYILKSNIFILSSIYEGLPNVLLEAITLKKYVISSDCPTGPKEILDYGKGGSLFKTSDVNDLVKKIKEVIENRKQTTKKIKYSYNNLIKFDKNNNLKKYFKLINSI